MIYDNIVQGIFLERPNRFIAYVEVDGIRETVHVKNTGRCKELLKPGAVVYLQKSANLDRKTAYDLVMVQKGERLINMDSQIPNKVVEEWLYKKQLFHDLVFVRPETKYGNSRFDFYIETAAEKIFLEVKGVTLEEDGVVRFPDAPSERAVKHVEELIEARRAGYRACVIFVIQMKGVKYFTPNYDTHPEFAKVLYRAAEEGVEILAYDCCVTRTSIELSDAVKLDLPLANLQQTLRKGDISLICKPLLKWYNENKRSLPWREEPTPYHVWVSEIMLQQTRVEAVKPYYKRFLENLPNVNSLATAQEQLLLKLWEGLGYYNRVRNMQKAACQVVEEYGGEMPDTYEKLLTLKGIGSYTAGAIASIAFGQAVPAVDGNVLRVVSRYEMNQGVITDAKVKQQVEAELAQVIPTDHPGDFNQAMMELGAMVCLPNGMPHCNICPLKEGCKAYHHNCVTEYPKKETKKARTIEKKTVLIVQDADRAALHRRADKGLLAGMYEFPVLEGYCSKEQVLQYLSDNGLQPIRIKKLQDSKHVFTHKEWHMKGFAVRVDELTPKPDKSDISDWIFVEPMQTQQEYPIPSAFAAYVPYLNIKLGKDKFVQGEEK